MPIEAVTSRSPSTVKGGAVRGRGLTQRVRVYSLDEVKDGKLKLLAIGEGHTVQPWMIAFRPDGKTLVTGDESGVIQLWDVSKLK